MWPNNKKKEQQQQPQYTKQQTSCADFPTGVELADDTTALLIY